MDDFFAIDFETANPKRNSACSIGIITIENKKVKSTAGYFIKPIGGHAEFQSKIHGITEKDTHDQPTFEQLLPSIIDIFKLPIVGHSLFDKQVLNALIEHYVLDISFDYIDNAAFAKSKLPNLNNHKLKTLAKYFELPPFNHHDAVEDALACANIFMKLSNQDEIKKESEVVVNINEHFEFIGLAKGILADEEVNYKEAYQLLYWLEDHMEFSKQHQELYWKIQETLEDDFLDSIEAIEIKMYLEESLKIIEENIS